MKEIQELSEMIEEEIEDATKYAKCAIKEKEKNSSLAETFYKLANEELGHMSALHTQVIAIIDEYRKKNGDPPESMLKLYTIMHNKHMSDAAVAKGLLILYKGG